MAVGTKSTPRSPVKEQVILLLWKRYCEGNAREERDEQNFASAEKIGSQRKVKKAVSENQR